MNNDVTEEFFQSLGSQSTQRQTSVPMAQDSPSFVDDDTIGAIASQQVPKEKTLMHQKRQCMHILFRPLIWIKQGQNQQSQFLMKPFHDK